jgi:hypothetical protein
VEALHALPNARERRTAARERRTTRAVPA